MKTQKTRWILGIMLLSFPFISLANEKCFRSFVQNNFPQSKIVAKIYPMTRSQLITRANKNHVWAQYQLGVRFKEIASPKYQMALKWFEMAAKQGHANAQYEIAKIYIYGLGVPKDSRRGLRWLVKAAQQKHLGAQVELKNMAEKGNARAQFEWGYINKYAKGISTANYKIAEKFLKMAAEQGYADAQYELGEMYKYSYQYWNIRHSPVEAMDWFGKAAKQNHKKAMLEFF